MSRSSAKGDLLVKISPKLPTRINRNTVNNNIKKNKIGDLQHNSLDPELPFDMVWKSRISASNVSWHGLCYGNGLFVATATSGLYESISGNRVMTSPNGINWTLRETPFTSNDPDHAINWTGVCYGNGLYVAVGSSVSDEPKNRVMTSPDGINWTLRETPTPVTDWRSVCYARNKGVDIFVAVGFHGGTRVMTSNDGITWTLRATPKGTETNIWTDVCFGNGLFVAISASGSSNRVITSVNGIDWKLRKTPVNNEWYSVCYGNGLFVAVAKSGDGNRIMTSSNGTDWKERSSIINNDWYSVTYGNGLFVAIAGSGYENRVLSSFDGIHWKIQRSASDNKWVKVCYGDGLFVAVSTISTTSTDHVMTCRYSIDEIEENYNLKEENYNLKEEKEDIEQPAVNFAYE